jgi:hypothetical protein
MVGSATNSGDLTVYFPRGLNEEIIKRDVLSNEHFNKAKSKLKGH